MNLDRTVLDGGCVVLAFKKPITETWQRMARDLLEADKAHFPLTENQRSFCMNMLSRTKYPTEKQMYWLCALTVKEEEASPGWHELGIG